MSIRPKRKGIMLCYPLEESRLEGPSRKAWNSWPVITQPKLDGERCRAIFTPSGECYLLSSTEELIVSVPHIIEVLSRLGLTGIELDGELYTHGMTLSEIHSRAGRTVNLHSDFMAIEFHVFDIVMPGSQIDRLRALESLKELLNKTRWIRAVPFQLAFSLSDLEVQLEKYINSGYEGIIIRKLSSPYERKRSTGIMKFKPRREDIYEIVGTNEEEDIHGNLKGTLGSFACRGADEVSFSVGSGLKRDQKQFFWERKEEMIGKLVRVKYQSVIGGGNNAPRFPIFVEVIDE